MEIPSQIILKLTQATNVLVIVSADNGDSLAAGLALQNFLRKMDKEAEILSCSPKLNEFSFLPGFELIKEQFDVVKSFVIDLSTKKVQIDELSYKKEAEQLSIFIKPKKGQFEPTDVTFRSSSFPFDLLVLIGIDSLDRLGEIYNLNTGLFFETPMLNIDFRASNESYAQYNLINLAATSNSEIIFDLISQFELSLIDESIATELLTGIISQTDSFQHIRTTPQTFLKASQLVGLGANQQEIISKLYKNKSLGLLKLWGRVLANLKQVSEINLVYSTVTEEEFVRSGATADEGVKIIQEMESQLGFAKLFIFYKADHANQTTVYFHSSLPLDMKTLLGPYNSKNIANQTFLFTVSQPLPVVEQQFIDKLRAVALKIDTTAV